MGLGFCRLIISGFLREHPLTAGTWNTITEKSTNNGQPMKKTIRMREMLDNQKGVIKRVSATGDMGRRIREMGLVPQAPIQIRGRAPLKDPVAVKIRDYVLTLRNNEADSVFVEVEEDASN